MRCLNSLPTSCLHDDSNTATLKFNTALGKDRDEATHTLIYTAERILDTCKLTRGGLLLVALLSGGDYDTGIKGAGIDVATGLARAGFGDSLLETAQSYYAGSLSASAFDRWLRQWREEMRQELRTNSSKCLKTLKPSVASKITDRFPTLAVLEMYVRPVTSEFKPAGSQRGDKAFYELPPSSQPVPTSAYSPPPSPSQFPSSSQPLPSSQSRPSALETKFASDAVAKAHFVDKLGFNFTSEPSIPGLAHICERFFEWGYRERLLHRFYTLVWPFITSRVLRRAAIVTDETRYGGRGSTSSGYITGSLVKRYFTAAASTPRSYSRDRVKGASEGDNTLLSLKITRERRHRSTDDTLEYRIFFDVNMFRSLAEAGIEGTRHPPDTTGLSDWEEDETGDDEKTQGKENKEKDMGTLRLWVPAAVLQLVAPDAVEEWKDKEAKKAEKGKKGKTAAKAKTAQAGEIDHTQSEDDVAKAPVKRKTKAQAKTKAAVREIEPFPMSSPPPIPTYNTDDTDDEATAKTPRRLRVTGADTAPFTLSPMQSMPISLVPGNTGVKSKPGRVDDVFKAKKAVTTGVSVEKPAKKARDVPSRSSRSGVPAADSDEDRPSIAPKVAPVVSKARDPKKNQAGSSKVAKAAELFADVDFIRDFTQRPPLPKSPDRTEKRQPPLRVRPEASKPRTGAVLGSRTVSTESHASTSTAASHVTTASTSTLVSGRNLSLSRSPSKRQPEPFPMSLSSPLGAAAESSDDDDDDDDEDIDWESRFAAASAKGKESAKAVSATKHPRPRTPERRGAQSPHKSPRRNAGQASPRRAGDQTKPSRTLENFWTSSDREPDSDGGNASPTPRKPPSARRPAPKAHPAQNALFEREVIVISSDEEDDHPPPRPINQRGRKRNSDPREVIEISD